jgi:hypothetical protein
MRRLISEQPSGGESDLLYFLESYVKLDNAEICSQRIDGGNVVVWVFANGVWESHTRPKKKAIGSWCQVYLTSILGLNQAQYEKAKKELFRSADGLSGVYRHRTEPIYAIVYKPSAGLSSASIAALAAGGAAVAGIGGLTVRHFVNQRETQTEPKKEPKKEPNQPLGPASNLKGSKKPSKTEENILFLLQFNRDVNKILDDSEHKVLTSQDFPDLDKARAVASEEQKTSPNQVTVKESQRLIKLIDGLIDVGKPQNELKSEVLRADGSLDYEKLQHSVFWNSELGQAFARYSKNDDIKHALQSGHFELFKEFVSNPHTTNWKSSLDLLEELKRDYLLYTSLHSSAVIDQLVEKYQNDSYIVLALRSAQIAMKSIADRPQAITELTTEYLQTIDEERQYLADQDPVIQAHINGDLSSPFDRQKVIGTLIQLRRNLSGYKDFKTKFNVVDDLPQGARDQADKSERLLSRLLNLNGSTGPALLDAIDALESKELPDDVGTLLMFANTFQGDEQDTDVLRNFRRLVTGAPWIQEYNRVRQLNDSYFTAHNLLNNQIIKYPETIDELLRVDKGKFDESTVIRLKDLRQDMRTSSRWH